MRVCVCMRVRMIVRTPRAAQVEHAPTEHKTTGKAEKPAYIGIIAGNEKSIKKV